jgi:hypothetical protein
MAGNPLETGCKARRDFAEDCQGATLVHRRDPNPRSRELAREMLVFARKQLDACDLEDAEARAKAAMN